MRHKSTLSSKEKKSSLSFLITLKRKTERTNSCYFETKHRFKNPIKIHLDWSLVLSALLILIITHTRKHIDRLKMLWFFARVSLSDKYASVQASKESEN